MRKVLWGLGLIAFGAVIGWGIARQWPAYQHDPTGPEGDSSAVGKTDSLPSPPPSHDEGEQHDSLRFTVRMGWLPTPSHQWRRVKGTIDSVNGFYFYTFGRFADSTEAERFAEFLRKAAVTQPLIIKIAP